jgi:hypothetical protein
VDDFNARPMRGQLPELGDDSWGSPKHRWPTNLERRLDPLSAGLQGAVRAVCAPPMERFGYS